MVDQWGFLTFYCIMNGAIGIETKKMQTAFLQMVRHANTDLTERFPTKLSRSLKVSGVNALYTFGMVIPKYFALAGILKAKKNLKQEDQK